MGKITHVSDWMDSKTSEYLDTAEGEKYKEVYSHIMTIPNENIIPGVLNAFGFENVSKDDFNDSVVRHLVKSVVNKPWIKENLDDRFVTYLSYDQFKEWVNICDNYPSLMDEYKNVTNLLMLTYPEEEHNDVYYNSILKLHKKFASLSDYYNNNPERKKREEVKLLYSLTDAYIFVLWANKDDEKKFESAVKNICRMTRNHENKLRSSYEDVKKKYKDLPIYIPSEEEVDEIIERYNHIVKDYIDTKTVIEPMVNNGYSSIIKYGFTKEDIEKAVDNINYMLKEDPMSFQRFYDDMTYFNNRKYDLKNDEQVLKSVDEQAYNVYCQLKYEKDKEYVTTHNQYLKDFDKLIAEKGVTSVTLFDVLECIPDFDYHGYKLLTRRSNNPNISKAQSEKYNLWREGNLTDNRINITTKEDILKSKYMLRGYFIDENMWNILCDYVEQKNYPKYKEVFFTIIKLWVNQAIKIPGFDNVTEYPRYDVETYFQTGKLVQKN